MIPEVNPLNGELTPKRQKPITWLSTEGLTSETAAKTDLSIENVDNTSDVDKPVSTSQREALTLRGTRPFVSCGNDVEYASFAATKTLLTLESPTLAMIVRHRGDGTNVVGLVDSASDNSFVALLANDHTVHLRVGSSTTYVFDGVAVAPNETALLRFERTDATTITCTKNDEVGVSRTVASNAALSADGFGRHVSASFNYIEPVDFYDFVVFNTLPTDWSSRLATGQLVLPEERRAGDLGSSGTGEIATADFTANSWTEVGGGTARFTADGVSGGTGARQVLSSYIFLPNRTYRVRVAGTPGGSNTANLGVILAVPSGSGTVEVIRPLSTVAFDVEVIVTPTEESRLRIRAEAGAVDWTIGVLEVEVLGATLELDFASLKEGQRQLYNKNSNDDNATLTLEAAQGPLAPFNHYVTLTNETGATIDIDLFGGDFQPSRTRISNIYYRRLVGTGAFQLGTSSGGAQIVASTNGAEGYATLLSPNYRTAGNDIFARIDANTTYEITVTFER